VAAADVRPAASAAQPGVSLDIDQCRCLAARNSAPVRLIAQELQLVEINARRTWCGDPHASSVHRRLLLYRAELRANESAAAALDLFFRLSAAEQIAVLLKLAVPQFDQARADMQTLRRQGLVGAQDTTELDRHRIQLDEQQRLLDESSVQAGAQLRYLLGMDPVHGPPIHPVVGGTHVPVPIDVDRAVATGLTMRPDLNLLRMLIHELDPKTLPFASGVLQQVDGSLGVPSPGAHSLALPLLKSSHDDAALEVRRSQLVALLQEREQAKAAEIRRAVEDVETVVRQMQLAERTIRTWQERLKDLDQRLKEGTGTPLDISTAKLRLLEARTTLVKHAAEARIAEIRLHEAQGILATGCCDGRNASETAPPPAEIPPKPPRW
jgi:outer membrane protein TolC